MMGRVRCFVALLTVLAIVAVLHPSSFNGSRVARAQVDAKQNADGSFSAGGERTMPAPARAQAPMTERPPELSDEKRREKEAAQAQTRATGSVKTAESPTAQRLASPPTDPPTEAASRVAAAEGTRSWPEDQKPPESDIRPVGPKAPGDYNQVTYSLGAGPSRSHVNEPSASEDRQGVVFATYNWYAARSNNGGSTWSFIDPDSLFPQVNGMNFCCDQDTIYDPSRDLTFWLIQYIANGTTGNVQRLAVANSAQALANNSWYYYDFRPEEHCDGNDQDGDWFDFPHLSLSNNNLYLASNAFRSRSAATNPGEFRCTTIIRIPLDQLDAGGGISYRYFNTFWTDTGAFFNYTATHGATSTMYFTRHVNTTTMRVHSWPESVDTPTSTDVTHASYLTSAYTCTSPGGLNPCGREDDRHIAGWVGEGFIGWMWDAPQGNSGLGNFAFPHVRVIRLNVSTKAVVQDQAIWNAGHAWIMPSTGINGRSHIGGTIFTAGGSAHPSCFTFLDDDLVAGLVPLTNFFVQSGTGSGDQNRWGDYLRTRKGGQLGNQWVGTCFAYEGTTPSMTPRVVRFGRERDVLRPSNDFFSSSINIAGTLPQTRTQNTANSTGELNEPLPCGTPDTTVWYTWTAPSTGTYQVTTDGSDFDTQVAVYTGSSVGGLTSVGCDDDSGPGLSSLLRVNATGGTTYRIQVDGFGGATGNLVLALSFVAPPRTLTVNKGGTGVGTVTGSGISCGTDCTQSYFDGTPVTLTATGLNGSTFLGWSGACAAAGTNPVCNVTMNANQTSAATFARAASARVGVQVTRQPPLLRATLTAPAGCGAISQVQFGTLGAPLDNASVSIVSPAGGPTNQTVGFSYVPPGSPTAVSFTVARVVASGDATVQPIVIRDGCGIWTTFVGGGVNAW
jgi:hypothetical protein